MRRLISVPLIILAGAATMSCNRTSDFITDTPPFVSMSVRTPTGRHELIAARAKAFAIRHGMKLHYVSGHFQESEYTISVTRHDLNIVTGNVVEGRSTSITAYSRTEPTEKQQAEVAEFLCLVMLHACGNRVVSKGPPPPRPAAT